MKAFYGFPLDAEDLIEKVLGWRATAFLRSKVGRNHWVNSERFPFLFDGYLLRVEHDPEDSKRMPELYAPERSPNSSVEIRISSWEIFMKEVAAKRLTRHPRWTEFDEAVICLKKLVPWWKWVFSWDPAIITDDTNKWLFCYSGCQWLMRNGLLIVRGTNNWVDPNDEKPRNYEYIIPDWKTFQKHQKEGDFYRA